jgi:metal-responsive CopG/Arc/MetJ family transcriptional regulator
MLTKEHKIVMGVSIPKNLRELIDQKRGDIPRSKYISRVLERQLEHENSPVNQQNQSRPLPGQGSAASPPFPSTH